MTKMKKGGVIAALCGIVAIGGGFTAMNQFQDTTSPVIQTYEPVNEEKDYTIMVYMIGSDLESEEEEVVGAGSKDLQEMMEVMAGENAETINEKVNLVVEVGGSYQWQVEQLAGMEELEENENIYEKLYYIGEEIVIEEEWDAMLEVVQVDLSECQFGFMIEDNRQQFQYTELLKLESSEIN